MKLIRHLRAGQFARTGSVVTLGNFDGVHVGHRAVLARLTARARERRLFAVAITFHPHPASVLAPERRPLALTTLGQRLERLGTADVDAVVLQRFSRRFSRVDADTFVHEVLVARLAARAVVIGHSTRFGRDRGGDPERLAALGRTLGFEVEVVGPVEANGSVVSSSAIRAAVRAGDLVSAAAMLGRPHAVCGRVIAGHGRGRQIGIPTANVGVRGLQLPPDGVYAVCVRDAEERLAGVANIGFNPTFGNRERSLEVHVLDFDRDLYGHRLEVELVQSLRGEVRFPDVAALVRQIHDDIAAARRVLASR
jgi:riboflavin kinase / FMN adenylyltransferase